MKEQLVHCSYWSFAATFMPCRATEVLKLGRRGEEEGGKTLVSKSKLQPKGWAGESPSTLSLPTPIIILDPVSADADFSLYSKLIPCCCTSSLQIVNKSLIESVFWQCPQKPALFTAPSGLPGNSFHGLWSLWLKTFRLFWGPLPSGTQLGCQNQLCGHTLNNKNPVHNRNSAQRRSTALHIPPTPSRELLSALKA